MKVKSHSFNGKKYAVEQATELCGICDEQGRTITILRGDDLKALSSALEEGLHAMGVPDKYLHKPENKVKIGKSSSKVDDLGRLIWRLGWRKVK